MADGEARLLEHYGRVLDEYRFQVDLNWKRSQYFLVLNLGVLVAATSLTSSGNAPAELIAALFLLGALLAAVSAFANHVQHGYYRATRELKRKVEIELDLGDLAMEATTGMQASGATGGRALRVRHALDLFLLAIAVADGVGLALAICSYP